MARHPKVTPAEQFARLAELDSVMAAHDGADPSVAPMLTLVGALRAAHAGAGPAPLSDHSRAAMRQRLVAVATVQSGLEAAPAGRGARLLGARVRGRVAALAATMTVATSIAGVGVAAAHSLPGDPFYGVKKATESAQLWLTPGEAAKGRRHLEFARTRLGEAEALSPNSSHLASTLAAMDSETRAGSSDLISAYRSSSSTDPLADLVRFSRQQQADLTKLAAHLPPALRPVEVRSLTVLGSVTASVRHVSGTTCLTCIVKGTAGGGPSPQPTQHPGTSPHPSRSSGGSSHPTPTASKHPNGSGGSRGSTSRPHSSPTPTGLLHSLLPTLPTLLHPKHHHHHHHHLLPSPLPLVSSVLGGLGL